MTTLNGIQINYLLDRLFEAYQNKELPKNINPPKVKATTLDGSFWGINNERLTIWEVFEDVILARDDFEKLFTQSKKEFVDINFIRGNKFLYNIFLEIKKIRDKKALPSIQKTFRGHHFTLYANFLGLKDLNEFKEEIPIDLRLNKNVKRYSCYVYLYEKHKVQNFFAEINFSNAGDHELSIKGFPELGEEYQGGGMPDSRQNYFAILSSADGEKHIQICLFLLTNQQKMIHGSISYVNILGDIVSARILLREEIESDSISEKENMMMQRFLILRQDVFRISRGYLNTSEFMYRKRDFEELNHLTGEWQLIRYNSHIDKYYSGVLTILDNFSITLEEDVYSAANLNNKLGIISFTRNHSPTFPTP